MCQSHLVSSVRMIFSNIKVLAVMFWMVCLRLTASQVPYPPPKLKFKSSVNESNIQLYTATFLDCIAPPGAPYPITLSIGRLESPSQTPATTKPWVTSEVIRSPTPIDFTIYPRPETEGAVVCWYTSTRNGETSGFSNPVNLIITSLPPPKLTLKPNLVVVGGNYTVHCESTAGPTANFSMSMYVRSLPVTPGNQSLMLLGSLNLTEGSTGIIATEKNAVNSIEYFCTMEKLYNGRVLNSPLSNFESAIPEELPVRLFTNNHGASCLGNLDIRLRDRWVPVCQADVITTTSSVLANSTAGVVCRELGCGHALGWKRVQNERVRYQTTGGIQCNGREEKIRDCPMDDINFCPHQYTLSIICSDALPPPKLSVVTYGPVSTLYVTDKQSVEISCTFDSAFLKPNDIVNLILRHNGIYEKSTRITLGIPVVMKLSSPLTEGEYTCVVQFDEIAKGWSQPSNSVSIYIYNLPDPVPIVAGVLMTAIGVSILLYMCVYKTKNNELESNEIPIHTQDPEATVTDTVMSDTNVHQISKCSSL